MALVRVQVLVPAASGVTADNVQNTFHFSTVDLSTTVRDSILTALNAAYEEFDNWKSPDFTWQSARAKFYDLGDPEPRAPIWDMLMTLTTAPSGTSAPHELAVCMSYEADPISGQSQARRRGRVYLGPINNAPISTSGRLSSTSNQDFRDFGATLLAASVADSGWNWVVYSPSAGEAYTVSGGWVDNDFDIQRRRGIKASQRITF